MAILDVLRFPDERLRTVAKPVAEVNDEIKQLISDMFETMRDEKGIGLAATQVDRHVQVVVMDVSEDQNQPRVFINPEITERDGSTISEEGCLSVPNNYAKVERAEHIRVTALDDQGERFELEAEGLLAICIQHELDHLKGKLFVDYLSPLKRQRIRKKLEKEARLAARA
ncbi:peptide deformylase [Salinimonas marina]|uniref:Peptide deformylase n=1 Tax=Salinimonas marina TaxID=2785918 RepID=A0A7S9HD97_9ALTE|nr:peptide deformylase [Salinimonas marina]QPG05692.1 peptide deformylase [Salinimonas marina]